MRTFNSYIKKKTKKTFTTYLPYLPILPNQRRLENNHYFNKKKKCQALRS